MQEEQAKLIQLKDKKQPHLTNLNEDSQLNGKLVLSLANAAKGPMTIGRDDSNSIVLKGVGIQDMHAKIKINEKGYFIIEVQG